LIQNNLFHGLPNEGPYSYLATYIEICNTVRLAGVPEDTVRLSLFSFSFFGEAKRWIHSLKGNSLKNCDEVVEKFLNKDQDGPSNRPPQQGPSLYDQTMKLEETLAQFMQVSMSNHNSTESAIKIWKSKWDSWLSNWQTVLLAALELILRKIQRRKVRME